MPKRCARCGDLGRIREQPLPGDWLSYLESERGLSSPVGRITLPLCPSCYRDAEALDGDGATDREAFLDELVLDRLVDEGV